MTRRTNWRPADYRLSLDGGRLGRSLVDAVGERTCRTSFDQPGFCLVDLGRGGSSEGQRALMVELKEALAEIHQAHAGRTLVYQSATRFDQQVTTKLHRDGGPDECFLMLGYEPTRVVSQVALADSALCAADLGLTETELLERHNPMFFEGEELLSPYITRLDDFDHSAFQILLVNNSLAAPDRSGPVWKGVLHTAAIPSPDPAAIRIINSSLIASVPVGSLEPVTAAELSEFLATTAVHRRGYAA